MAVILCSVPGCRCRVAEIVDRHIVIVDRHHGVKHVTRIPLEQIISTRVSVDVLAYSP